MKKFLSDSVELQDDVIKDETHTVTFERKGYSEVFYATSNITKKIRRFVPKLPLESITDEDKVRIIYYNTGEYQEPSDVSLREIFVEHSLLEELTPLLALQRSFAMTREQQEPFELTETYYDEYGILECDDILKENGFESTPIG